MEPLYFKCKLLTDVIISESSATVGHQASLDYIPGSNFLGICATYYDELNDEEQLMMFHTGDVQFGDAHVEHEDIRTLRIPASMYYPKGGKVEEECYIHHAHKHVDNEQLKQCRKGFYAFKDDNKKIYKKEVGTSYALKSGYDYKSRRSEDNKMYGYESMDKGLEFLFEVRISDKATNLIGKIKEFLIGQKTIGRSKTAQYGLVEISEHKNKVSPSYSTKKLCKDSDGKDINIVYADSRLIFMDKDTGRLTFRPTAEALGFKDGKIDWSLSQVRTFQYAPWNGTRKTYDADRCGIEKGSVFVIRGASSTPSADVVGMFKNEGFGKVIYNPEFLDSTDNGLAVWKFVTEEKNQKTEAKKLTSGKTSLLRFINKSKEESENNEYILKTVNDFVDKNKGKFKSDSFKSQWGNIRSIAASHSDDEFNEIYNDLFNTETGYLMHGVAKDKWEENGRLNELKKTVDNNKDKKLKKLLINLASEMQKAI